VGLFLLKFVGVVFTIFWFLSFATDEDNPWIFRIIPSPEWLDDWFKWLEIEHKPIYWLIMCILAPIVFLYSILPLFILGWIWSL